jgi:geranylgeranyl diphosphate synthase, type II
MLDVRHYQEMIESSVRSYSGKWDQTSPVNLYAPVSYALNVGGKRVRPLLALLAYQLKGNQPEEALPAAMAVEVFHNFTLLHDDIMDKAELRRNQPAVHIRFNINTAILSGDVMAFVAYRFLLESKNDHLRELIALFTQTAIEICEGQQLDMDFESLPCVTTAEYLNMIRLKTAVLLACALKSGALLGGISNGQADLLYEVGINLGLAFQLQDDLLDTFGEETLFGKKIGGDILCNKKTFLLTEALQQADGELKKTLQEWLAKVEFQDEIKVQEIKSIYEKLHLREKTAREINTFYEKAIDLLDQIEAEPERKTLLSNQCELLIRRKN